MVKGLRGKKMGAAIQREIAACIFKNIQDPRLEGVTITHVELSDDLSRAKVYFFVPEGREIKVVLKGFESAKGYLRTVIAEVIKTRRIPALTFIYDDSLEFFEKAGFIKEKDES